MAAMFSVFIGITFRFLMSRFSRGYSTVAGIRMQGAEV